ncbi:M90 family metallopeptidase [Sphingobacterium bovistauri]|uniref:M90 family metallopeptidase n=1 Tax=Sphingobacterium bovistauri TaxID=2781959 RepID=UPI001CE194EC|nr:M90 family metallopeptidase [Sphingobacterium bovistauri]
MGKKNTVKDNFIKPIIIEDVLENKVSFYTRLDLADKEIFRERVIYFLQTTKISPEKGAVVTDEDKVLIAASATIPLFHFHHWAYENLDEVLIYPDFFDEKFGTVSENRNVAGMVGTGFLNHKMILSLPALRTGFMRYLEGNTAIHEFVHLIDKADGEIDGVPEYLIPKELINPWLHEMDRTIKQIREGKSDIREYAATNDAEFLAVVSEYFFKKPKQLQEDHPKLYSMLNEIYTRK